MRIAVVGATRQRGEAWRGAELVSSIAEWSPHAVVQTGGSVARGSAREWQDWERRWDSLADRVVALPDRASRRKDRKLEHWRDASGSYGVSRLEHATWTAETIQTEGVRWRIVLLDTEARAMGTGWLDQRTWLPKAVSGDDYDQLLVVTNRPLASLQDPVPSGSGAMHSLLADVATHGDRTRLRGVISGGTRTNEVLLHSGPFGEVHLVAGNGSVDAADLSRRGESTLREVGDMALVDGFDAALRAEWGKRLGSPPGESYTGDALPVRGWWQVELSGRDVSLAFLLETERGAYRAIYRIQYTRRLGWVAVSPDEPG